MGSIHDTTVHRDTKFSRYQYRRGHGTFYGIIYKRDTIKAIAIRTAGRINKPEKKLIS